MNSSITHKLKYKTGNLLEADVEALVNTVNTAGVMGKGIALQFRQAFPENYAAYRAACKRGEVQPGAMFVTETGGLTNPRYIINFPTKRDWRAKAKMEDIETGLSALVAVIQELNIQSLAVPPLGCGNGGLDWAEVKPKIEAALTPISNVDVLLFSPDGAPNADAMPVATNRPNMTPTRAAMLGLLNRYALPGYRITMLEAQKLAYFLQMAGEPMHLAFDKNRFGPYAEMLHHILQRMESHFICGYGDRSRGAEMRVLPDAEREADLFLEEHPETMTRMTRVFDLIDGFETPRGLELLATVHWLAQKNAKAAQEVRVAIEGVQGWSPRKHQMYPVEQIEIAWQRLAETGWLNPAKENPT